MLIIGRFEMASWRLSVSSAWCLEAEDGKGQNLVLIDRAILFDAFQTYAFVFVAMEP